MKIVRFFGFLFALLVATSATFFALLYKMYLESFSGLMSFQEAIPELFISFEERIIFFYQHYGNFEGLIYAALVTIIFGSIFGLIYYVFFFFTTRGVREKRILLQRAFSHYISPSVIEDILKRPEGLTLGGKSAYLTVYFLDIENFSELMVNYHPKEIVEYLNEFFSVMAQIVLDNEGTIDKYEGDAIMAFWGAPKLQEDHTVRACRTALQHQRAMAQLRAEWKLKNRPEFFGKIGIASGDMVVGNIGSMGHFNYTVIGRAVNGGVHLEKLNRTYGTDILVGEKAYHKAKHDFEFREIDAVEVKGYKNQVRIFELLAEKGKLPSRHLELVNRYHEALELYRLQQWEEARKAINDCLRMFPEDTPSQLLKDKITFKMKEERKNTLKNVVKIVKKEKQSLTDDE